MQDLIIASYGINDIIGSCQNTILHQRPTAASPLVLKPVGSAVAGIGLILIERIAMVKVVLGKIARCSSEGFGEEKRTEGERFMRVFDSVSWLQ